jgi:hypothetical protein
MMDDAHSPSSGNSCSNGAKATYRRFGGKLINPLDFGVSYQFLSTLSGTGDFSDLFKAHATWWLTENAGSRRQR